MRSSACSGALIRLPRMFGITSSGLAALLDKLPNRRGGIAPACRATSRPDLNSANAGIEFTQNRCARTGSSSVFTLVTSHRPGPLGGDLDQFGRDHFARFAPRSPELNEHGELVLRFHLNWFGARHGTCRSGKSARAVRRSGDYAGLVVGGSSGRPAEVVRVK